MKVFLVFIFCFFSILFFNIETSAQCLNFNTQETAGTVSGESVQAATGSCNTVTNTFNGEDYAVFNFTTSYSYEWQIFGAGGFATPKLSLITDFAYYIDTNNNLKSSLGTVTIVR